MDEITHVCFDEFAKVFYISDSSNCVYYLMPQEGSLELKKIFDCREEGNQSSISKIGYRNGTSFELFFEENQNLVRFEMDWKKDLATIIKSETFTNVEFKKGWKVYFSEF